MVLPLRACPRVGGKEPLLSTSLFRNRASNLGLITQNIQWLLLMGSSFTVAAYLQVVRGYDAIATGVIFTAATLGLLATSLAAERLARRRPQRTLIIAGFAVAIAGVVVLIAMVNSFSSPWAFAPGLLLLGLGLGLMLTPSVNIVQSSFPRTGRARSPVCPAVCRTSAPRWAPRSPARSSWPDSPPAPTPRPWSPSPSSGSSDSSRRRSFPDPPSARAARRAARHGTTAEFSGGCRNAPTPGVSDARTPNASLLYAKRGEA